MRQIKIFDTTLRDGEQSPGCSMQLNEKLSIAKQLEKLKVDIIEAGYAFASPGNFESIKAISKVIKDSVISSLSRALQKDIDSSYDAIKDAAAPRIHIFLATSKIHMQYKLKMNEEEVLKRIAETVKYAKSKIPDIEFSAEDASRSDRNFLYQAIDTAIKAGATTINLPDTVGYSTPWEMFDLFSYVKNNVANIDKVCLSAHNHDDLGLAVSNTLACVKAGAGQLECTVAGIGERAGNAALEEIVMSIHTRKDFFNAQTQINTQELYNTSKLLFNIIGRQIPPNKAIVGANAFAHESGIHQHGVLENTATYEIMSPQSIGITENKIVLGKHSGKHAFSEHLTAMGYQLSNDSLKEYFEKFKILADKKKNVTRRDIEALIDTGHLVSETGYSLDNYSIKADSKGYSMASITLLYKGEAKTEECKGLGPVDAAFSAINKICKKDFILEDYSLNAVTEGEDAQGDAVVKMKLNNENAISRGVSTDIIEASILAYINGVNKILKE